MKQSNRLIYMVLILVVLVGLAAILSAAGLALFRQRTSDLAVDPNPAATAAAQQAFDNAVFAAVQATSTAQALAAQPAVVATPVIISQTIYLNNGQTNPSSAPPVPDDYIGLSEEELITLINQTAQEAAAATTQYATTSISVAADNTITPEEVQAIEVYVTAAGSATAETEAMIKAYYQLYADLSADTQAELAAINQRLTEIAASLDEMNQTLHEISDTLNAGLALAEETIAKLEATVQKATAQAAALKQQAQTWQTTYQNQVSNRVANVLNMVPTHLADSPQAALQDAIAFLHSGQQAMTDRQLTQAEFNQLAQLGANARAGLSAQDLPQLQQLSGRIAGITEQFARGDLSQAELAIQRFDGTLSSLPQINRDSLPFGQIERPTSDRTERSSDRIEQPRRP
jgi:hypothetical protein